MSALRQEGADVLVFVRAKPRASKSRVLGVVDDEIQIALAAPPVDGAANTELLKLLARALGLGKSRVKLERGEASRHKVARALGVTLEAAEAKLLR